MERVLEAASDGRQSGSAASRLLVDPLTGFGTRHALLLALTDRFEADGPPTLLVVFGLDGFDEYTSLFGRLAGRTLLVKLAARLAEALAPAGVCFRPRHDEFSALIETTIDAARPVLDAAVIALRERASFGAAVTAAWGAVLLPDEAGAPGEAIRLADERLASNVPRRRRRNRRGGGPGGR
jgi:GGDEF domain-containing protein